VASWYGGEFHGRPTASGEIYDMNLLTAAHRELPLHSLVEVQNLDNGHKIQVRINDRGPFVRGRILDLSYGAARELGMIGTGLARVEVRIVQVGSGLAGPSRFSRYTVQLGAFRDEENAVKVRTNAERDYPEVQILTTEDGWHRVRVGSYAKRTEAQNVARKLQRRGLDAIVVPVS
jgi:rare lipoprotein A